MAKIVDEWTDILFQKRENEEKHPGYESEMRLYDLIAEGRIKDMQEFRKGAPPSDAKERGVLSEDPVRNSMYHMVAMTTLISRVCISHGIEPEIAYEMSDIFIRRADKAGRPSGGRRHGRGRCDRAGYHRGRERQSHR